MFLGNFSTVICELCAKLLYLCPSKLLKHHGLLGCHKFSTESKLPGYNYGLDGSGKGRKRVSKKPDVNVRGEVLFGIHPVNLALRSRRRQLHRLYLQSGKEQSSLLINNIIRLCDDHGIPTTTCSKSTLTALSGNRPHQAVCLDASVLPIEEYDASHLHKMLSQPISPLWLFLYKVKDPMNLGNAIRSAYCLGADRVFISRKDSADVSPLVSKASAGAAEVMEMNYVADTTEFLQTCKSIGCDIVGTTSRQDKLSVKDIDDYCLQGPTVLLMGNEAEGLDTSVEDLCDTFLTIDAPTTKPKFVDSLNVTVATGIILHRLLKSRHKR